MSCTASLVWQLFALLPYEATSPRGASEEHVFGPCQDDAKLVMAVYRIELE